MPKFVKETRVELRARRAAGDESTPVLPPLSAALVGNIVDRLLRGDRVAVLSEGQKISPNDAAIVLGMSRPLVAHQMNVGDLPFRCVGRHRRAKLGEVLALKTKMDAQRAALATLTEDTEDLICAHALQPRDCIQSWR